MALVLVHLLLDNYVARYTLRRPSRNMDTPCRRIQPYTRLGTSRSVCKHPGQPDNGVRDFHLKNGVIRWLVLVKNRASKRKEDNKKHWLPCWSQRNPWLLLCLFLTHDSLPKGVPRHKAVEQQIQIPYDWTSCCAFWECINLSACVKGLGHCVNYDVIIRIYT